jgi:hypothetical protein
MRLKKRQLVRGQAFALAEFSDDDTECSDRMLLTVWGFPGPDGVLCGVKAVNGLDEIALKRPATKLAIGAYLESQLRLAFEGTQNIAVFDCAEFSYGETGTTGGEELGGTK